jgi:hypothetical protein
MTILDSLLRQKRWVLAERGRHLEEAVAKREQAAKVCVVVERGYGEAQRYLWEQLSSAELLCVQRLTAAKQDEWRRSTELRNARKAHEAAGATAELLRKVVARLHADIEKLEEKRDARRAESLVEAQRREWTRLDEWVAGRHGRSEP